ncbi:MAG TPA: Si-specific NAD(P)(+) transhydrogenase [Thermoanaerobaculia bacterium]|nr:Si-specific NAD(P)(+) transhydrogenase [Thermoanaerobaculia bacterium]
MSDFDLIVIGTGPAGEKGAAQAAYFKKTVAIVEKEMFVGGACVNTGTIPSKTLRETALHLSGFAQREVYGIDLSMKRDISVADLMTREKHVVDKERRMIDANLDRHRVQRFGGTASFKSAHEVVVSGSDGTEKIISGDVILIATGSSPSRPSTVPFDQTHIFDSDSILALDRIPKTLAVVGAGVIGCEYASIFASLGVKVSLVDGRTTLLPFIDREVARILLADFQSRLGIDLFLGSAVKSVARDEAGVHLQLENGFSVNAEKALYAAGRSANTSELNLAAAGVQTGKNGVIIVNEKYQTNVPNIFAAGDVIGFPALASTSMEQARVAMVHAFDLKYKTKLSALLPYAIYTIPELSSVGMSEQECRDKKIDFEVGRAFFRNNARGQIIGEQQGLIKLVFDARTLAVLGVHIIGESASDLLHVGLMVMQLGGTLQAFIDAVFNFPTLGEAFKYAAYDGLGNLARRGTATKGQSHEANL